MLLAEYLKASTVRANECVNVVRPQLIEGGYSTLSDEPIAKAPTEFNHEAMAIEDNLIRVSFTQLVAEKDFKARHDSWPALIQAINQGLEHYAPVSGKGNIVISTFFGDLTRDRLTSRLALRLTSFTAIGSAYTPFKVAYPTTGQLNSLA